jgi:hypothetical protein
VTRSHVGFTRSGLGMTLSLPIIAACFSGREGRMAPRHGHRFWEKYRGRPGWYLVFMVAQKNAKRCNRCTPDARVAAADRYESATVPPCSSPLSQSRRLMSDISDAAVSDMSDGNTRAEHEKRTEHDDRNANPHGPRSSISTADPSTAPRLRWARCRDPVLDFTSFVGIVQLAGIGCRAPTARLTQARA